MYPEPAPPSARCFAAAASTAFLTSEKQSPVTVSQSSRSMSACLHDDRSNRPITSERAALIDRASRPAREPPQTRNARNHTTAAHSETMETTSAHRIADKSRRSLSPTRKTARFNDRYPALDHLLQRRRLSKPAAFRARSWSGTRITSYAIPTCPPRCIATCGRR